jgi:hypothetical protein
MSKGRTLGQTITWVLIVLSVLLVIGNSKAHAAPTATPEPTATLTPAPTATPSPTFTPLLSVTPSVTPTTTSSEISSILTTGDRCSMSIALATIFVSLILFWVSLKHTNRAFRAANYLLLLIRFPQGRYKYGLYIRMQNSHESKTVKIIDFSARITGGRDKGIRFRRKKWVNLDVDASLPATIPAGEFASYEIPNLADSIARKFPSTLEPFYPGKRHNESPSYQVLQNDPFELEIAVRYQPVVSGAQPLKTVFKHKLVPDLKSAPGTYQGRRISSILEGWTITESLDSDEDAWNFG